MELQIKHNSNFQRSFYLKNSKIKAVMNFIFVVLRFVSRFFQEMQLKLVLSFFTFCLEVFYCDAAKKCFQI